MVMPQPRAHVVPMSVRPGVFVLLVVLVMVLVPRAARAEGTTVLRCGASAEPAIAPYLQCASDTVVTDEGAALLYCPSTPRPLSLVVLAPDLYVSKWSGSSLAQAMARRGYAVAMVEGRIGDWTGGDASRQFQFAAKEYAEVLRRVTQELLKAHGRGAACELSGAFAIVGEGRGADAAVFAAAGDAGPGALVLLTPPITLQGRTTDEVCATLLGAPCPKLAAPTLFLGGTYYLKPEASVRPIADFVDQVFSAERAHIDVLDDETASARWSGEASGTSCIPLCRRPAWDRGEAARAVIADRLALWLRAYVDGDLAARAALEGQGRVTLVHSPPIVVDPEYARRIAAERAAKEARLNRPVVLPLFSFPGVVGGATRPGANGGGFAVGLRPEIIVGALHDRLAEPRSGVGIGGYLSAMTISGQVSRETLLGGGASLESYTGDFGFALSGGVDVPTTGGSPLATVGAFVGFRGDHDLGPIDMPFGLRIDGRFGPAEQTSITVAAQLDLVALVVGAGAIVAFAAKADRYSVRAAGSAR